MEQLPEGAGAAPWRAGMAGRVTTQHVVRGYCQNEMQVFNVKIITWRQQSYQANVLALLPRKGAREWGRVGMNPATSPWHASAGLRRVGTKAGVGRMQCSHLCALRLIVFLQPFSLKTSPLHSGDAVLTISSK